MVHDVIDFSGSPSARFRRTGEASRNAEAMALEFRTWDLHVFRCIYAYCMMLKLWYMLSRNSALRMTVPATFQKAFHWT